MPHFEWNISTFVWSRTLAHIHSLCLTQWDIITIAALHWTSKAKQRNEPNGLHQKTKTNPVVCRVYTMYVVCSQEVEEGRRGAFYCCFNVDKISGPSLAQPWHSTRLSVTCRINRTVSQSVSQTIPSGLLDSIQWHTDTGRVGANCVSGFFVAPSTDINRSIESEPIPGTGYFD